MNITIYDLNEQYIGNIICDTTTKSCKLRNRIRNTIFSKNKDTEYSVWKCSLFRKHNNNYRIINEDVNIDNISTIYVSIREIHGITITKNPYDFQYYWDRHLQFKEEVFNYMIYSFDNMINEENIYDFEIITKDGKNILEHIHDIIKQTLIPWIYFEKNLKLFDLEEWKVYHQLVDPIDCADEYLVYHKLFCFQDVYFELGIKEIVCYCIDKSICPYCKIKQNTEFKFILRQYGNINQTENNFIPNMYWKFSY